MPLAKSTSDAVKANVTLRIAREPRYKAGAL